MVRKGEKPEGFTDEPRDALELIARLLVGGSYRLPVEGRSTAEARLTSADIAGAVGYMRDPLERRTALAVATRADDAEAVIGAAVGRLDIHCDSMDGTEICEFSPHGSRSRAKKLDGQQVRLVRVGGGA